MHQTDKEINVDNDVNIQENTIESEQLIEKKHDKKKHNKKNEYDREYSPEELKCPFGTECKRVPYETIEKELMCFKFLVVSTIFAVIATTLCVLIFL